MRDCVRGTPIRRRRPNVFTAVALAAALALLVSCSSSGVESGSAVKTPDNVSPGGAVDVALLDVGNYPTKPSPLMGSAGTAELGAIVEGQRMANYVTVPWEADPSLIRSYANSAVVLKNAAALKFVLPEDAGRARGPPRLRGRVLHIPRRRRPQDACRTRFCGSSPPRRPRPPRRNSAPRRPHRSRPHPAGGSRTHPWPPRHGRLQPHLRAAREEPEVDGTAGHSPPADPMSSSSSPRPPTASTPRPR